VQGIEMLRMSAKNFSISIFCLIQSPGLVMRNGGSE
jgi:hypothetical protein